MAKPIPDGYHTLTPYLIVRNGSAALEFYAAAFGAVEKYRLTLPGGAIAHAEMTVGDSVFMLSDEMPEWGSKSPRSLDGTPCGFCLYVPDCDAAFAQAVAAGATVKRPLADQFYGDRSGTVTDPFGHDWTLATHKVDVPPSEYQARMEAWMAAQT